MPTLRGASDTANPQRHLLKTIYEEVKYPAKAREARRGGPYLLSISVDDSGSTWEARPLTTQTEAPGAVNLVVVAADNTQGAPVSGQMKVNADRALLEETERIGRYLVNIGFDPALQQDAPVGDTLNLVFYYRIEE